MPWDRKRLLGYVETIQLVLGVTDKRMVYAFGQDVSESDENCKKRYRYKTFLANVRTRGHKG